MIGSFYLMSKQQKAAKKRDIFLNNMNFRNISVRFLMAVLLIIFSGGRLAAQHEYILIDTETNKRFVKKDSLSAVKFLDSLSQNNYYFTKLRDVRKDGNTTQIFFEKGPNYNQGHVQISDSLARAINSDTEFYSKNIDSLKKAINQRFMQQGFSFNRVKSKYLGMKSGSPRIEISVIAEKQRVIDGFVVRGYDKVPKRFIKNLTREFQGKTYGDKTLLAINQGLQNHAFMTLERPPQTLFTRDSTQIYLFLQKKKVNSFDGMIGFGNDESEKFTFNGTLNLQFRNMFNGFESIGIYWQRNPDKGQTFDLNFDIPYMLQSNVGMNLNMNIYRQDSTFANVKMIPAVYYNMSSRQKIGLRGTFETSTIIDSLYIQGKDYTKKGIGLWYDYTEPTEVELFLHRMKIRAEADLLSTNYSKEDITASQMRYYLFAERNIPLRGNHWLNLRGETALLSSKNDFTVNELLRFGGWNSMRGYNENSLIADFYFYGNAEYRYLVNNQAFFDVFLQYGQLTNNALGVNPKLYSFGIGFNFFLPIGLMSFQISNGSEFGNQIRFGDTKIHWGILTRF